MTDTNGERVVSCAHMHILTGTSLINFMHLTMITALMGYSSKQPSTHYEVIS